MRGLLLPIARSNGSVDWIMRSDEAGDVIGEYWSKIDVVLMGGAELA